MMSPVYYLALLYLLSVVQTSASNDHRRTPEWNGLVATMGRFETLPRTEKEAKAAGWTMITEDDDDDDDDGDDRLSVRNADDCDAGNFLGFRYVLNNDHGVVLLFDVKGFIAGLQTRFNKSYVPDGFPLSPMQKATFIEDGDFFTTTIYFTDPAVICTEGRSRGEFRREGTGSDLYLQAGTDPLTQSQLLPRLASDANNTNFKWTKGFCMNVTGLHYWSFEVANDCLTAPPLFLLYEKGRLVGFGFMTDFNAQTSLRFEPYKDCKTNPMLAAMLPKCVCDATERTSLHIWLKDNPMVIGCDDASTHTSGYY